MKSRAPLRVSFAGGGTDLDPFRSAEGGCVLNATINLYVEAEMTGRADGALRIDCSPELAQFVADVMLWLPSPGGQSLQVRVPVPRCSGLGASSSIVVALIGLLPVAMTRQERARLACVIERQQMKMPGGLQDQWAAACGGINLFNFVDDSVLIDPIFLANSTIEALENRLLLCFTGNGHPDKGIIEDQVGLMRSGGNLEALRFQKFLAKAMVKALTFGELDVFGNLLGQAWHTKKQMSGKITNPHIDAVYDAAVRAGALGGKITGAGGGGHMLFCCAEGGKGAVAEAVGKLGAAPVDFKFEFDGLVTDERDPGVDTVRRQGNAAAGSHPE